MNIAQIYFVLGKNDQAFARSARVLESSFRHAICWPNAPRRLAGPQPNENNVRVWAPPILRCSRGRATTASDIKKGADWSWSQIL